ncbi:hypothetical protein LINPERHAP2_LOCUS41794 [Linum perenne]
MSPLLHLTSHLVYDSPNSSVPLTIGRGLCIGGEFAHVVSDGMGFQHFVKSWAALFRFRNNSNSPTIVLLSSRDRN